MAEGGGGRGGDLQRQNTSDETLELHLKVPVSSIIEHFKCVICMGRIRAATVTHCGHRYCETCIAEWINLKHKCPMCNADTTANQLIRDHGFDSLMSDVSQLTVAAEKEYYDRLVSAATSAAFEKKEVVLSPLETVLRKHLKHSMAQHEAYHQKLLVDYQIGLAKLAREKHMEAQKTMSEYPHDPNHPARVAQMAEVEGKWEAKKQHLQEELERVEKVLADAYDRYLTENLSPPSTIPISVKLTFPEKGFEASDIVLKPDETMASIVKRLQSLMVEKGMEIVHFPPLDEIEMSFVSPFAPDSEPAKSSEEEEAPPEKTGSQEISFMNQVVQPDCRPVLQYSIKPGTEIRFKGKLVLQCDLPKMCFAATFENNKGQSVDYFTCKTCNYNWVCRPCSEVCHKGHDIVSHVMNHKPTWACCYCAKKKKCCIQKSFSAAL
ncbi:hypothetical protein EMCRGX_G022200 [Ephydatia muelleri]|eukprot:Em0009g959a